MIRSEDQKKCKFCNKKIPISQYKQHKRRCNSQLILNPQNHALMSHYQVIQQFLEKYNQLYHDFLHNKTVALIGPAESITGTQKGHVIDQFDIIVRLNKSLPLPEKLREDIGSRTDVLYNSLNVSDFPGENKFQSSFLKKHDIKFLSCPYPIEMDVFQKDILNYIQRNKFEMPFRCVSLKKHKSLEQSIQTRPFTGVSAIVDLLSYPIKYLYISGLDFYYSKYYSSYRRISKQQQKNNQNNYIHQSKPQINLLKHLSLFDDRIILDKFLDQLLYRKYYEVTQRFNKLRKNMFMFDDPALEQFFKMNISNITYSLQHLTPLHNEKPTLLITNNKHIPKKPNLYILYICDNIQYINLLNKNLDEKKYIGNFFYKKNKNTNVSIFLNPYYIQSVKAILRSIHIHNCNIHFLMFLILILYSKENHYFSHREIMESWGLSIEEKKYYLFLKKKNGFRDIDSLQ